MVLLHGRTRRRRSQHIKVLIPKIIFDENGNDNPEFPHMHWTNEFSETGTGTKVEVKISFANEADLEKILEMALRKALNRLLVTLMSC